MTASDHATERRVVKVTPNEVRAARLQLVLDEKMGHETPAWIRRLAEVDIELPGYGAAAQLPQPEHQGVASRSLTGRTADAWL